MIRLYLIQLEFNFSTP